MELCGIRGRRQADAMVGNAATACALTGAPGFRSRFIQATGYSYPRLFTARSLSAQPLFTLIQTSR
jgi:hypothetical protein